MEIGNAHLEQLLERLGAVRHELEDEFERTLVQGRKRFRYTVRRGKVRFEREMRRLQRRYRIGIFRYLTRARISHLLSAPLIYALVVPLVLLDLSVSIYQQICFRLYGIPRVGRGQHVVIDRHNLAYLNGIEKINCIYCGYGNGVIEYAREVAARTEQYWCPIKHARRSRDPHQRSERFAEYGDAEHYRDRLSQLRDEVMREEAS
jgi:hypothetical protein